MIPHGDLPSTIERIHRLRPSDIEAIRLGVGDPVKLQSIAALFLKYLLRLNDPLEVELDDVSRVTLQFQMATVWDAVSPAMFVATFQEYLDVKVVDTILETLGRSKESPISDLARDQENLLLLEEVKKSLGLQSIERSRVAAMQAMRSKIEKLVSAQQQKSKVKRSEQTGTVKWFNAVKGFGFIQPDGGGTDIFIHISEVERAGLGTLSEGQRIKFDVMVDQASESDLKVELKKSS